MNPETRARFEAIWNRCLLYSVAALTLGLASLAYLAWIFPRPNENPPNFPTSGDITFGTFASFAMLLTLALCAMVHFERKRIYLSERIALTVVAFCSIAPVLIYVGRGLYGA